MPIRPIEPEDVPAAIDLGYQMHQESVYRHFNYDPDKCGRLIYDFMTNPDTRFAYIGTANGVPNSFDNLMGNAQFQFKFTKRF